MGGCAIFHREKGFFTFLVYIKAEATILDDKCWSMFLHKSVFQEKEQDLENQAWVLSWYKSIVVIDGSKNNLK